MPDTSVQPSQNPISPASLDVPSSEPITPSPSTDNPIDTLVSGIPTEVDDVLVPSSQPRSSFAIAPTFTPSLGAPSTPPSNTAVIPMVIDDILATCQNAIISGNVIYNDIYHEDQPLKLTRIVRNGENGNCEYILSMFASTHQNFDIFVQITLDCSLQAHQMKTR